jgi:DNA-binding Xre family transcriptional regulator
MKTKINELCRSVGITTAYQLQKATNLSPSQAARLYKDDVEAISLSVLEKLCDTLKCSPNAIFGYDAPGVAKHQIVKTGVEKPTSTPETPNKPVFSSDLMTTEQVAKRLEPIAGKILSNRRILDYVKEGKLKSKQSGNRTARFFIEADYLEFEAWYKENILKQK